MGLDAVPAWFLQLGAPGFAASLATLLNQSISANVLPQPLLHQSQKLPSLHSAVISDPFLLRLYFPDLLKDTLYDPLSILHHCTHHSHFVSVTSLRVGLPILQRQRLLLFSTLLVTCCQPTALFLS